MPLLPASRFVKRVGLARPIPVFVLSDSPILVMALNDFLRETSEVRIVGSAVRLPEALSAVRKVRPKVVLMDPGFEAEAIVETIRDFRAVLPSAGLFVFVAHQVEEARRAALAAGADAYISQWAAGDHLVGPIRNYARHKQTLVSRLRA